MSAPAPETHLDPGEEMYALAKRLFPINRSLTGPGVRETLDILREHLPDLVVHAVPSGTPAFDWTVPPEWSVREAYVIGPSGQRVIDFATNNLHLVGYSEPIDTEVSLAELQQHLYSIPEQPTAIPYVTSYYQRRWGFCLTHQDRVKLPEGRYRVRIDAELKPGVLNYGELYLKGEEENEVLLSTYVCHPSMANNELSGPVVTVALAKWLAQRGKLRRSYRIVFIPETIGSIVYLSRHLETLRRRVVAGYVVTCVGDNRTYSYVPSRLGNTLADRVARHVLKHRVGDYRSYSYLERGSDERQYCSPGVDLPMCSVLRSKYGEYPEYHTSLDNLELISPAGLQGAYDVLKECLEVIECDRRWRYTVLCEPQLGRRGLYPTLSSRGSAASAASLLNILAYADGSLDLVGLAEVTGIPASDCAQLAQRLADGGLLTSGI